jgi:hypothetical protein
MNNRALITVLGALSFAYLIAIVGALVLYNGDQVVAIGFLSTAFGVIVPTLLSLKQSSDNAMKIAEAITKVEDNTALTQQVSAVADETHLAVNSRMDSLIKKVQQLAEAQKELAAAAALAKGITIGRDQATHENPHRPGDQ